ncbi:glycerophosphodiester phosphodiesterase [Acinetobacter seifertii]|uniref:glycerophosphodiester phosphodiesterase n=1 Tax=Acinetobacter seifertii TaxID=1530123 RepID=A0A7H2V5E8_9GAMM|nr:glycerophosphodiester phosphodiesterase [Acinetobacter seifertii]MBZ6531878.1 glycerophosphodiester phosphodiesterase [Acinetobacter seifertii]QNW92168.1 glycerophosphodiester phosphodiesterase [Acinetobacter seifertii]QNX71581.1 glycerophosphodiester phosphodiesterase [Acinetobacter seifertii]
MFRKALLCLSLVSLVGCNDDDKIETIPTTPEYQLPKILVIGHRGASALRPEHTLASYQKAIDDGADFIEPDLVSTKDGVLVTRHENEIGGTTNISTLTQFADRKTTKNIDGVNLTGWFTEDLTLNELQQVKARERIPEFRPANTAYNDFYSIPTLEQVIELAEANYKKTGKIIGLYIETKHPTYFKNKNLAMEDTLLKTLAKYQYTRDIAPIYLQSFEVSNLKYLKDQLDLHKTLKHAQIIQLYDAKTSRPADFVESGVSKTYGDLATAQSLKDVAKYANGVGPSKNYILNFNTDGSVQTTSFISDAHAAGLKVHPYTFRPENNFLPQPLKCSDKPAERCPTGALKEFEAYFKAGVDGVFTDDPALGRQAVTNFEKTTK